MNKPTVAVVTASGFLLCNRCKHVVNNYAIVQRLTVDSVGDQVCHCCAKPLDPSTVKVTDVTIGMVLPKSGLTVSAAKWVDADLEITLTSDGDVVAVASFPLGQGVLA